MFIVDYSSVFWPASECGAQLLVTGTGKKGFSVHLLYTSGLQKSLLISFISLSDLRGKILLVCGW